MSRIDMNKVLPDLSGGRERISGALALRILGDDDALNTLSRVLARDNGISTQVARRQLVKALSSITRVGRSKIRDLTRKLHGNIGTGKRGKQYIIGSDRPAYEARAAAYSGADANSERGSDNAAAWQKYRSEKSIK